MLVIGPTYRQQMPLIPNTATHFAEILKYAMVGVSLSAGIVAHIGTTFGGFGEFLYDARISCTVSNEGCTLSYGENERPSGSRSNGIGRYLRSHTKYSDTSQTSKWKNLFQLQDCKTGPAL